MNKKLLLSFALAAAMTGCINDADVPSGNGDNPAPGARGGNMEISFVVPNSSNGSRAASAEDSGIYEDGTAEEYKVSNVTLYLFDSSSKNLVTTINVTQAIWVQALPAERAAKKDKPLSILATRKSQ